MFKCEACGRVSPAGQPSREVVLEIRQKTYLPFESTSGKKRNKKKKRGSSTGFGWETARSAKVCTSCAPELESKLADRIAALATPAPIEELAEAS